MRSLDAIREDLDVCRRYRSSTYREGADERLLTDVGDLLREVERLRAQLTSDRDITCGCPLMRETCPNPSALKEVQSEKA